ncbi:MAG: serine/threonine protein kinase, partial [Limnospira sp. PMC 289.06]|nr:serine/threonine protein kinase [Limnospira sp. PMC 289.06]
RYQNYIEYLVNFLSNTNNRVTNNRVLRGGSWGYYPVDCRCAGRSWVVPGNLFSFDGFRVACAPPTLSP